MKFYCKNCKKEVPIKIKTVGPHIGAYCFNCGNYIKWLSKNEKKELVEKSDAKNEKENSYICNLPTGLKPEQIIVDENLPWEE